MLKFFTLNKTKSISRCKALLGTYVTIKISAQKTDNELINLSEKAFSKIAEIESLMSFHKSDSELSCINKTAHESPKPISKHMKKVISQALELSKLSDGAYDVSVASLMIENKLLPKTNCDTDKTANWEEIKLSDDTIYFSKKLHIDLGGIAKGYAVDQAFELIENEVSYLSINAGGDTRVKNWQNEQISVKNINDKKQLTTIKMQNESVATSAGYYIDVADHAIISLKTKKPINDKRSISVFAKECMPADALTKIVFLCDDYEKILKKYNATSVIIGDKN